MSKSIFYIGIMALLLPVAARAQQSTDYTGKVKIVRQEMVQRGDSLYFYMHLNLNGNNVDRNKSMDITPVLTNGIESVELPMVSIQGKRKYKEYRRQMALMSAWERQNYTVPYAVLKGYGSFEKGLEYTYVLPFEPWMANAFLEIKNDLCGCGKAKQTFAGRVIDQVTLEPKEILRPYVFKPVLAFASVTNRELEVKQRAMQGETFLDFAVSTTDIRPEFGNNPRELKKLRGMIDTIRTDKGVMIRGIDITGYASPEGSLALNKRLSEGRAKSLNSYLQSRYDFPKKMYSVHFGGEDWEGLVKLLQSSDISEKDEILSIIENYSIEDGREKRIMDLSGGQTYQYLLNHLFPSLRRVVCRVDYDVRPFNVEEAKEVIKTRPQNLSLNEMYAVANTYEEGSKEFCDVFEIAVRMFPEDETANLNAAIAALSRKDGTLAKRYLDKMQPTAHVQQYDNAMGVMYILEGDYKKAAGYLETAAAAGLSAAKDNLKQIQENGLMDMKK